MTGSFRNSCDVSYIPAHKECALGDYDATIAGKRCSITYRIYVLADYDVRDTGKRYSCRRPPSPGTVTSPGSIWLPVMPLPAETQNWSQPALILDIFLSQTLPFLPSLYVLSPLLLRKWGDLLNSPLRAAICPLKKRSPPFHHGLGNPKYMPAA